jgi:hypothetical protein
MKQDFRKWICKSLFLTLPLFLFAVLLIPYGWFNQKFVVEWFGCGCPETDALGNIIEPAFNANDFTALFWTVVALCVTTMAFFLSKKQLERWWGRVVYILAVLLASLLLAQALCKMMMWR